MKNISELVDELLKDLDLDSVLPRRKALARWNAIAGKELAVYCSSPVIDGDCLHVLTRSPAAAMELKYRSSEILSALNREAGAVVFRTLKVSIRLAKEDRKEDFGR